MEGDPQDTARTEDPGRSLAAFVADEAPVAARRASAVLLAVARAIERGATGNSGVIGGLDAADVIVHPDGSVTIERGADHDERSHWSGAATPTGADEPGPSGASIGRLLFELLVGRAPLGREDAFEPAITTALTPDGCALMARSCSDAPGQWPSVEDWIPTLEHLAGGQAAPPPPSVVRGDRMRRALVAVGLALLAAASIGAVLMAPTWWDAVNDAPTHETGG